MSMPKAGLEAPDFSLPDQDGKEHSLSDYSKKPASTRGASSTRGGWVLLYFYPKDDTPGCTKEACVLRDSLPDFKKLKAVVLGVSVDSVKSHKKFADKYELPFTLLADEDKKVVKKYGVWGKKKFMGREYMGTLRTSFLIDPTGKIKKVYENVKPPLHADEVLEDLKSFLK